MFLPREAGAFGNIIEYQSQRPRPKLKKYVYNIVIDNIWSDCNPME